MSFQIKPNFHENINFEEENKKDKRNYDFNLNMRYFVNQVKTFYRFK